LYIYCSANAGGAKQAPYLRKIVLQSAVPVTINYKDEEDNTIANSVTEFIEIGETYTPTYKTPYYVSDEDPYTYTYKSGGDARTITASTSIDIVYSKSDRPLYTITTIKKYGDKSEPTYADVYEGATYAYYYPKFVLDGTTLYEYKSSTDASASASYWTSTLTDVSGDAQFTLTYEAKEGTCVYYAEGEDIEGASLYTNATFVARSSNGGIGVLNAKTIATLEAGVYTITARVIGRADRSVDFFMGSTEGTNIMNAGSATTGKETTSDIFTLSEATDIVANGGYVTTSENGHGFDYIYIMKPVVSATITSAGYATFCNANALDFKAAGVQAYIITGANGTALQLESVDDVPANTPVVLEGNEGSYSIPVIASSETDVTANKLVGVSADTPAIVGTYVLQTQSGVTGFYKVETEGVTTVKAGKAYLNYTAPGAKALYFDGEATAIEAISALTSDAVEGIYTVGGAKLNSLQKGINIVKMQNGTTQKVLVK